MDNFSAFFEPRSIAIIGASSEKGKLGHDVIRNLTQYGYKGEIYPVNRHADQILGLKVFADVDDLPQGIDLAVIVIPAQYVSASLAACGKKAIKAAIIVSGGFREVGEEGAELERQLQDIAREYNIAILGPNCIGVIDTHTAVNTTFVKGSPLPGNIAFISQSGAIVASLIHWAENAKIGFSRMVSLGNQAGVTVTDMLQSLEHDPNTRVVTAYIESIANGAEFVKTAQVISAKRPLIVLKAGRSSAGARAAASHTGALAGVESAYDAAFRRSGVLRANTLEELLDWARAFAMQPLPHGKRIAVVTNAGGHGILTVDALEAAGLQLAQLTADTKAALREQLPPAASVNNPVDVLAGSKPVVYKHCLDTLLQDETVDAIVVITAPQDWFAPDELIEVIAEANRSPRGQQIPVLSSIMGLEADTEAQAYLQRENIPNYDFPERVGTVLGAMWKKQQYLSSMGDDSSKLPAIDIDRQAAETAVKFDGDWLTSAQVKQLLNAYSIPLPQEALVGTLETAKDEANRIGFPLVAKLQVKGISHKTDIGGVIVGIDSLHALEQAFATLISRVPEGAIFEGILLQQMIRGELEAIVGVVRDPIFGAVLMVGSGGTQVELFRDVTFELAPLSRQQAEAMLARTSLAQILAGYRGSASADKEALIDIMQLLGQIALDFPEIAEIEINPVIVQKQGKGAVVVDARVKSAEQV